MPAERMNLSRFRPTDLQGQIQKLLHRTYNNRGHGHGVLETEFDLLERHPCRDSDCIYREGVGCSADTSRSDHSRGNNEIRRARHLVDSIEVLVALSLCSEKICDYPESSSRPEPLFPGSRPGCPS